MNDPAAVPKAVEDILRDAGASIRAHLLYWDSGHWHDAYEDEDIRVTDRGGSDF